MYAFFFQAEDGIRDPCVTGVQTCALPILVLASTCGEDYRPAAESLVRNIAAAMEAVP